MTNDSSKPFKFFDFGTLYDCEAFAWKITNVSSIVHEADHVVQSPPFSFDNATWILKMYPYGQTVINSVKFIDVVIERLHRQEGKYEVFIKLSCKDAFDKEINTTTRTRNYAETLNSIAINNFMQNIKDCPEKWKVAPNDTFTLVLTLGRSTKNLTEQSFQEKSVEPNLGEVLKLSRNSGNPEFGEIFKESFLFQSFIWKLCEIPSSLPLGYKVQSNQFSFANAIWILNVYPYYQMKDSNNPSYDVGLERFESEIPEHFIIFKIGTRKQIQQTAFFNAHHTQGDMINFPSEGEVFLQKGCLHFAAEIKSLKNVGFELSSQIKLVETTAVNSNSSGSSMALETNKVLQDLRDLYLKQEDCDVIIKVKGQEFPAHRLILKARSPVLASAFRNEMKEKITGILNIEDCDPSSFSDFLSFVYCGEIKNLSEKNAFSLFTAADKYDIADLRAMCLKFIKQNLSIDTFCDAIALALLHSESELMKLSIDFFTKNLQEIIVTVKWQSFILENPIQGNELIIKALVPSKK